MTIILMTILSLLLGTFLIIKIKKAYSQIFNLKFQNEIDSLIIKYSDIAYDFIYANDIFVWVNSKHYPTEEALENMKLDYFNFFEEIAGEVNIGIFIDYFGGVNSYYEYVLSIFDIKILNDEILILIKQKQINSISDNEESI